MSKNKRPSAAEEIYDGFTRNPRRRMNGTQRREVTIESMYYRILSELSMNRFKWSGLPDCDTVSPRYIEKCIYEEGMSVFYWDDKYNAFFALPGGPNGQVNMIGDPLAFNVFGFNRQALPTVSARNAVPIYGNTLRTTDSDIVHVFAKRLANFETTIEINGKNARVHRIVAASEETRLTYQNIQRQSEEGAPVIYVNMQVGENIESQIKLLDLGMHPDSIEKLDIVKKRQWDTVMGLMGINNANQDKKERLVESEVSANDDQISAMRAVALNARKTAAHKINKRYGFEIEVEYNVDIDKQAASMLAGPFDGFGALD